LVFELFFKVVVELIVEILFVKIVQFAGPAWGRTGRQSFARRFKIVAFFVIRATAAARTAFHIVISRNIPTTTLARSASEGIAGRTASDVYYPGLRCGLVLRTPLCTTCNASNHSQL